MGAHLSSCHHAGFYHHADFCHLVYWLDFFASRVAMLLPNWPVFKWWGSLHSLFAGSSSKVIMTIGISLFQFLHFLQGLHWKIQVVTKFMNSVRILFEVWKEDKILVLSRPWKSLHLSFFLQQYGLGSFVTFIHKWQFFYWMFHLRVEERLKVANFVMPGIVALSMISPNWLQNLG